MSKGSARSGILIEGLMIVVSILLAFVIQAWWEGRDIRADRVAALVSLRQDFEGYTALIDSRRVRNEDAVAAASEVLSWTGPDAQPVDELGSALVRLMGFAPLDLSPGSVANLVGSDGRKLIENLELQDALIEWAQALERLARRNEFVAAEAEKLNLYITDRYPFRSFYEGRFLSDSRSHSTRRPFASIQPPGWLPSGSWCVQCSTPPLLFHSY